MSKKQVKPADYLFWAVKQQTGNQLRNHILIILADHMGQKGCFPSYPAIAKRCECSRPSVARHIVALDAGGWITKKHRATEKGVQTSNEYTLNLYKDRVSEIYPRGITEIRSGYQSDTGGGITEIHETPIIKHPIKHTPLPPSEFDDFYAAYPKKVGRGEAHKAWNKLNPQPALINRIMSDIIQRVELGAWCTGKGKQYIPGPAPYLNQARWTDEIIPRPEFKQPQDFSLLASQAQDLTENL